MKFLVTDIEFDFDEIGDGNPESGNYPMMNKLKSVISISVSGKQMMTMT